jgi:hypothetical protein
MPEHKIYDTPFTSVSHVGVPLPNISVSPLSLRERARVRAAFETV